MKNILLIITLFAAMIGRSQAADTSLQKSAIFKDSSKESYIVYAKDDGLGGFYMVRMFKNGMIASASGYYVEHYDKNMAVLKEYDYAPEYHAYEKFKTLVGVLSNNNQLHLIEIQYNIKEKAYLCTAHTTALNDFKFTTRELFRLSREEADKLGSLKLDELFYNSTSVVNDSSIVSFIMDDDQTSFGVCLNLKSKENKTFRLYTFDASLNKKLDHTYVRDVKNKHFAFRNIDVADNGNSIYLLGAVHIEENKKHQYNYEITHVTASGEKTAGFENDKPFAESLKMLKVGSKLVCAGLYSEDKAKWYSGMSYFDIDPQTLVLRKVKHTPFSQQLLGDKTKNSWWLPKFYKPLVFRDFIVTEDEDIIINAEEYYITNANNDIIYNSDDIVTAAINKEGETLWITNINKINSTHSDVAFISYTPSYKNGMLNFYINAADNVRNLDDGTIEFKETGRNRSAFTQVSVDGNGKINYKKLLDKNDNEVPFMSAKGIVLPDAVFFLGRRGSNKQLLKVNL